ncbi:GPI ethanolamine phosphate transferase 2 isoform X1 [Octopus bimaculoides]|uniref:GPI ethanolamine phosphate transferase 2 C-terminal domain-containing protein n=1 Tax=Octopus bimaculoides TaxID=37653 RepID=A0A0L8GKU1_OCTBM|nr:GPI ethanolamine phosphate transferase 2 isoform X1 [Octopus bimaculoides]|eukprot:XP_014780209.1 PREDICTED: GPI ethanolamine phosphate transferase 2-like isoform X1 [Octopus bimaculoides]
MATLVISQKVFTLLFVLNFFLFYCTYLFSLFPLKNNFFESKDELANISVESDGNKYDFLFNYGFRSPFSRVVVMVIDSLRADFVIDSKNSNMKYVQKLLKREEAIAYYSIAHPPTVTLPRIKAMMTGTIPGYMDVILNFGAQAAQEDNLIFQLYKAGKKIVFYGDNTWINLFPAYFHRQDGTVSFFVSDYTEVDTNVSRHLEWEMQQNDWDVMILHYLGLDHIGHMAKPSSPLVEPKLQEMDKIIEFIHQKLREQHQHHQTLMVICGDHGMSDQGSHGGSSHKEVTSAMIWLNSADNINKDYKITFLKPFTEVDQIDITATLAIALGVAIPRSNIGVMIPDVLLPFSTLENIAHSMYINANQVLSVFKVYEPKWENNDAVLKYELAISRYQLWKNASQKYTAQWYEEGKSIVQFYHDAMKTMSSKMLLKMINHDVSGMLFSNINLWLLLYVLVVIILQKGCSSIELVITNTHCLCFFLIGLVLLAVQLLICSGKHQNILCSNPTVVILLNCASYLIILLVVCITPVFLNILKKKLVFQNSISAFVVFGTILHSVSLMSSSFIEEEHQTWYFLTCSLFAITSWYLVSRLSLECSFSYCRPNMNPQTHKLDQQRIYYNITNYGPRSQYINFNYKPCVASFLMLVLCRSQRMWNNTGDKWRDLPDLGDWLMESKNKTTLSIICAVSLLLILIVRSYQVKNKGHLLLLLVAFVSTYLFHVSSNYIYLPSIFPYQCSEKGVNEAYLIKWCSLLMFVMVLFDIKWQHLYQQSSNSGNTPFTHLAILKSFILCLQSGCIILSSFLTSHPHNIVIIATAVLQEVILSYYILPIVQLPPWCVSLIYTWMANATFFYQGHSNSLSSIDVAAGYFGSTHYQPLYVGILLTLATYSGMMFWYSSLVRYLFSSSPHQQMPYRLYIASFCMMLFVTVSIPAYTLLVFFQRFHLFIWTVFSPKLLFIGMLFLVTSFFVLIILLFQAASIPVISIHI